MKDCGGLAGWITGMAAKPNLDQIQNQHGFQSSAILLWLGLDWPSKANIWCLVRFSSLCAFLSEPKKSVFWFSCSERYDRRCLLILSISECDFPLLDKGEITGRWEEGKSDGEKVQERKEGSRGSIYLSVHCRFWFRSALVCLWVASFLGNSR